MTNNHHNVGLHDLSHHILNKAPPIVYYIPNFITEDEEEYLSRKVYEAPKPKWTNLLNRRLQNLGGVPHEKGMIPDDIPKWLQTICDRVDELGTFDGIKANHILVNEYLPGQGIMPHTDGPMYFPSVANITLNSHGVLDLYHPIREPGRGEMEMRPDDQNQAQDPDQDESSTDIQDMSHHSQDMSHHGQDISSQQMEECRSTSLEDRLFASILLERRSLLIVQQDIYSNYLHGIREIHSDEIGEKFVNLDQCAGVSCGDVIRRDTRLSLTIRNVPKVLKSRFLFGRKR